MQKCATLVDLGKCYKMSVYPQKSAPAEPRMGFPMFPNLREFYFAVSRRGIRYYSHFNAERPAQYSDYEKLKVALCAALRGSLVAVCRGN